MLRIVDQQRVVIIKYRLCFFKRNVMLLLVDRILVFIPCKALLFHNYIIIIPVICVKYSVRFRLRFEPTNVEDRAEIRGEVRGMLRADKYKQDAADTA